MGREAPGQRTADPSSVSETSPCWLLLRLPPIVQLQAHSMAWTQLATHQRARPRRGTKIEVDAMVFKPPISIE